MFTHRALGTTPNNIKKYNMSTEETRRVNFDWPTSAAETFSSKWKPSSGGKFRFSWTSGYAVPDPGQEGQRLWMGEEYRKLRVCYSDVY